MLTTRPHLTTFRPSPTTVSYTVSTTSLPSESFTFAHATHWFLLSLRVLVGVSAVWVLLARYYHPVEEEAARFGLVERGLLLDGGVPWIYLAPSALGVLVLVLRRFGTGMCI